MGEHNCYKTNVMERIEKKTYDFWVQRCRKQSRNMDYWLDVEKAIMTQIKK